MENANKVPKPPKPATQLVEQARILHSRGLDIGSEETAINTLEHLNYYRIRGYYIHLQQKNCEDFIPGTTLKQITDIHEFDSKLRIVLLALLFNIEIAARTRIAYIIGNAWGPLGYRDESNYTGCNQALFKELIDSIDYSLKTSKERFIRKHVEDYNGDFPIWVAVEVMSFGDLSKLYSLLPTSYKKSIANAYDYLDEGLLKSWYHVSSVLRNICAHNCRIYNRRMPIYTVVEKEIDAEIFRICPRFTVYRDSLFAFLLSIRRIANRDEWHVFYCALKSLINEYSNVINIIHIGFPFEWESLLLDK
jgi:abortive infection bacteriophage resistance protein